MAQMQLVLLRHAKSSWTDPALADHARPLNARGRRAAALVGRHLHAMQWQPDLVLCSSATRTRQTLELLGIADAVDVEIEDSLYGAEAGELVARIRRVPAVVKALLLIGHNPGLEDVTSVLIGGDAALAGKFPTGAMADVRLPIRRWEEVAPGIGRLEAFVAPRDLS